jgi:hypothetical protein
MSCEEKARLVEMYNVATAGFSATVKELHPVLVPDFSPAYRSQLGGTDRAVPDVSIQAFLGCVPPIKRFQLNLSSLPR